MARILQPNGKPFTPAQYEQIFKENPELRGKYNKYGYEESDGLKNFGRGALRSLKDIGDSAEYLFAKGKDWWHEGEKGYKPVAKEVSDRNIKSEQDYQEMTDGSIAAGLGRAGGTIGTTFIPVGGVAAKLAQVGSKAASMARLPTIAVKPISALNKTASALYNSPNTIIRGATRGTLGYGATNAKDENSASLGNVLMYGAGGGALAAGAGRLIGGKPGSTKKMSEIREHVDQGFSVPPSSMPHAPIGKTLEAIAGKNNVKNEIAIRNTANAQRLARKELGLPVNYDPITDVEIAMAKETPAAVYNKIRSSGAMISPDKLAQQRLLNVYYANKNRTGLGSNELGRVLKNSYQGNSYPISDTLDDIRQYRDLAKKFAKEDDNFSRKLISDHAENIENSIEKSIGKNLIDDYRSARKDFAKIYDVDIAIDGNKLNPLKLAKSKNKNAHTGGLKSISGFARAYPNFAYSKADNVDYVNAANILRSGLLGGAAGFIGGPSYALTSIIPMLASKTISHPYYQRLATSKKVNYPLEKFGLFMQNPAAIGAQSGTLQRFINPANFYESEEY